MVSFFPLMNALISISQFHKILTRIIVFFYVSDQWHMVEHALDV